MKLIDAVINNLKEIRKEYLLQLLQLKAKKAAVILNTSFGSMKIIQYYSTVQKCTNSA